MRVCGGKLILTWKMVTIATPPQIFADTKAGEQMAGWYNKVSSDQLKNTITYLQPDLALPYPKR